MAQAADITLEEAVARFVYDPLGFVYFIYPWGQAGTLLEHEEGPDTWQIQVLEDVRHALQAGDDSAFREAIASGHGVGKSTLTAWMIHWYVSTRPHPQVVVTANTKVQLETKTWRELAKWRNLAINGDWFKWTATKYYHVDYPETWFASAIPWSKDRPEAFAGTHERYVMMIFDEASAIDDIIWETAEGAMTTPMAMWFAFGNPTRNTGRFRELFPGRRFAHRWESRQVDSRQAKMANQDQNNEWIADYGEDSDFVRVRVRGVFPRASALQFIGEDLVEAAQKRQPVGYQRLPLVLGVDVARFGDDKTVILARQGPALLEKRTWRELDTMQTASLVSETIDATSPRAVFIDVVGIGAGVVDRLRQLGYGDLVIAVNAGETPTDPNRYVNKRAEMWDKMRQWIKEAGCLDPLDRDLAADLTGLEYGYDARERLQLERKQDMKARGLASPDEGDALALTFAQPVASPDVVQLRPTRPARGADFNPMSRW